MLETLKARLADVPGVETLTLQLLAGRQSYGLAGKLISVDATATEAEAEAAIRAALGPIAQMPIGTPAGSSASLLPAVALQPKETKPMATPASGSFAASLKALMDEARAGVAKAREDGHARVKDAIGKLNEAKAATEQVTSSMAKTIEDEAASVMSELGQISNDLTGEGK